MTAEADATIRRILVALDASEDSVAALEAAVALAARLQAELLGLFVEDVDLVRAAGLPYAREVRVFQSAPRSIDTAELEAQLRARALAIERALARAARRADIAWTFRRVRGRVELELVAATGEADLVVLGRAGHSPLARRRLGSAARAVLVGATRPVLLLGRSVRLREPAYVVVDAGATAGRALALAEQLTRGAADALHVLLVAADAEAAARLRREVADGLAARGVDAAFHELVRPTARTLARVAGRAGAGVLIAPADLELEGDEGLADASDEAGCPLLLVR